MKISPLLDHHQAAGARIVPRPEAPTNSSVLTYGDVPAEYRAGVDGALLLDVCDRGRLVIGGSEGEAFLHRLLANDVRGVPPDTVSENLLLSPKGKVLFAFALERSDAGVLLSTPPGVAASLATALDTYLFSEDVTIEDASEATAPLELGGPSSEEVLARAGTALDGTRIRPTRVAGGHGFRIEVAPERVSALWEALRAAGAQPGGIAARDILRVEAGAALFGVDVDENVYPQEARLEGAFSLEKGCYIGQEVVAKIDTYGGLNKRLMALHIDHQEPVPWGTRILREVDGEVRDLGVVTSWAYSFVLDAGLALGYVKRRHQEPGTRFELSSGGNATLVELPVRAPAH